MTLFKEDEVHKVEGMKLAEAEDIVSVVLTMVDTYCNQIIPVGSIRRKREKVNDVDFIVMTDDRRWTQVKTVMTSLLEAKIVCGGSKILRTLCPIEPNKCVQVDFYRAVPENWGIMLLIRTGSADHNVWLAKYALKRRMRLNYSKGVLDSFGNVIAYNDEDSIFKALGLKWVEPKLREVIGGKPMWLK